MKRSTVAVNPDGEVRSNRADTRRKTEKHAETNIVPFPETKGSPPAGRCGECAMSRAFDLAADMLIDADLWPLFRERLERAGIVRRPGRRPSAAVVPFSAVSGNEREICRRCSGGRAP